MQPLASAAVSDAIEIAAAKAVVRIHFIGASSSWFDDNARPGTRFRRRAGGAGFSAPPVSLPVLRQEADDGIEGMARARQLLCESLEHMVQAFIDVEHDLTALACR